jgi:GxxExxY protein
VENQSEVTERVIGCGITRQVSVPVQYKGHWVGHYQIDFIAERQVIVEVKSVEHFHPIFEAQMLAYLRATGLHVGLLLNFNTRLLTEGVQRFVR